MVDDHEEALTRAGVRVVVQMRRVAVGRRDTGQLELRSIHTYTGSGVQEQEGG